MGLAFLGARTQCQHEEERGKPSVPVHRLLRVTRSSEPNIAGSRGRGGCTSACPNLRSAIEPAIAVTDTRGKTWGLIDRSEHANHDG
jgi:hypothetical protein